MRELSAIFQGVLDSIEGRVPPAGSTPLAPVDAVAALESALHGTILPRRITVRAEGGARLSVVAKNRRVIKVAEVHPPELWTRVGEPQETMCSADYDDFAHPFATALIKVVGDEPIRIEQALIADPIGKTGAGYPASKLIEDVEQSQKRAPAGEQVGAFFDAFPGLARARFGDDPVVEIPETSGLTAEWVQEQVEGVRASLEDKETDVRFLILSGDAPRALALVWLDGAGCLVVSEDAGTFDALEQSLDALRPYL